MLKIVKLTVENLTNGCVTDDRTPRFSFTLESDHTQVELHHAVIRINEWEKITTDQVAIPYAGPALLPFTTYRVRVEAFDNCGESATSETTFDTGRFDTPWNAQWITHGGYRFTAKKESPLPMVFRKQLSVTKTISSAKLFSTALGIYEFEINGKKVGKDYFAPGFTSYKHHLQYQVYDVTSMLTVSNQLTAIVAGGWAVGKFTFNLRNRIFAPRQALLAELRITYTDGTIDIIGTDTSWQVTLQGNVQSADFYDGEHYDATVNLNDLSWVPAHRETIKLKPQLIATYGSLVQSHEVFHPVLIKHINGTLIYDMGQNFSGVIDVTLNVARGTRVVFRHAEMLKDGQLFTAPLRTAKAQVTYIAQGIPNETYSPRFTYMGFRYVSVEGVEESAFHFTGRALYSDIETIGHFECSNERLNQLQNAIVWSTKSNFVDIPTDCPQRDERMGWTGDIALFAPTALFNFNSSRFLDKWLRDLKLEQKKTGGIPVTIPHVVFPSNLESVFTMAIDHWGDACILVPWAHYQATGDRQFLETLYPVMQRYLKACRFWAELFSIGQHRRIWSLGHHYGDWVAYGIGLMGWMKRGKWTATASLAHSAGIVAEISTLLGYHQEASYYNRLRQETANAYLNVFTNRQGQLKNEFQTGYVLPLNYGIFQGSEQGAAAQHLSRLVNDAQHTIRTGFPGTPGILFALADNGHVDDAFKMLLNEACPSWLHMMKSGGTTMWERFDAFQDENHFNIGQDDGTHGMVSFNHYANGAVGSFLYRRIAGIEMTEPGYKKSRIAPLLGGNLTSATGRIQTSYGLLSSQWTATTTHFLLSIQVPVGTQCEVVLPNQERHLVGSGSYDFACSLS